MREVRAAIDCHRCGCSWNFTAMFTEDVNVAYECCPECGWLAVRGVGTDDPIIVFDPQDERQVEAVRGL